MTVRLQEWIHKFEEGPGSALLRAALGLIAMLAVALVYDLTSLQNFSSPEGMDQAQLARNIAEGKGYTTSFIRPLSLHLIFQRATNQLARLSGQNTEASAESSPTSEAEERWLALLQQEHPDLANPPLYPVLLAGVLKFSPFGNSTLASQDSSGLVLNDLWITLFNQFLFLLAVWLVFRLAQQLFDRSVAWVSAIVLIGSEVLWQLTTSGQAALLQVVIALGLVRALAGIETGARQEIVPMKRLFWLAGWAGALVGLGSLTRYALSGLIFPVVIMIGSVPTAKKTALAATCSLAFLLVFSPWVGRNYYLSGTPFGTAGFALFQQTASFPEDTLERSVNPDFREFAVSELRDKAFHNLSQILQSDLPRLGGSWMVAFFLVGLLMPFRNRVLSRVRGFILLSIGFMILIQSLGRTANGSPQDSAHPDLVLVTFAPFIVVFGTGFFFTLFEQLNAKYPGIRFPALGLFCLVMCAPLLLAFLTPKSTRIALPYYPPWIEEKSMFLSDQDWMMSDIPWAVAWYGHQSCIWLPPYYRSLVGGKYPNDFFAINDFKSVGALYLSSKTLEKVDSEPLRHWVARSDDGPGWENSIWEWESFVLVGIYLKNEVPTGFPLKNAPLGIFPELFLVDSEHIEPKRIQSP